VRGKGKKYSKCNIRVLLQFSGNSHRFGITTFHTVVVVVVSFLRFLSYCLSLEPCVSNVHGAKGQLSHL
jgi:hypothetical protein